MLGNPRSEISGLQNTSWDYPRHDFVIEILDLPTSIELDLILFTQVLDHVPDPVGLFSKW